MELEKMIDKYAEFLIVYRSHLGGWQKIYRFPNDYGASVVRHMGSYGLELAVIKFYGKGDFEYDLTYDTKITNDVVGYLTWNKKMKLLGKIKRLKK